MLHALSITIPHPDGGEITLNASPPEAFETVMRSLGAPEALEGL
jgi:hypothetical protein